MTTNMGSLRYVGRSMSLEAESVLKNRPHKSINHDHLKATLDILKSMRYHRTEKKPWLDEEGNVIWSLGRRDGRTLRHYSLVLNRQMLVC